MIIVLFVIFAVLAIVFYRLEYEILSSVCTAVSIIAFLIMIALIAGVCTGESRIDAKLEMYEKENARIEQSVEIVVKDYLDHENKVYDNITTENAVTVVALAYPELASKDIVKEQIALYESNNKKIKDLKEQKIDIRLEKFWLYFGQ